MYKGLTIFGKITVMKTFVLSSISHFATVLPTPTPKKCKASDNVNNDFIRGLKIPWLKRLQKDSTCHSIHLEDIVTNNLLFDPFTANEKLLKDCCKKISNPVESKVYSSIIRCKKTF